MIALEKAVLIYLAVISLAAVVVCVYDKLISKKGRVELRVPERTLLTLSVIGGSLAMYITMQIVHHKTKHAKFMIGLPIMIIIQATLAVCYFYFLK